MPSADVGLPIQMSAARKKGLLSNGSVTVRFAVRLAISIIVLALPMRVCADLIELPRYESNSVEIANDSYLTADGAIKIVGYNDMQGMLTSINRLFQEAHPKLRFDMVLKGTRTGPPALADGTSAFAPMGAPFSPAELRAYRKGVGSDPVMFRVAHASLERQARSGPLGIFVADSNPISAISMDQLKDIFAGPNITLWSAFGLEVSGVENRVQAIGLSDTTALGLFFLQKIQVEYFASGFRGFPQSRDVIDAIALDPSAIGFAAANLSKPGVRLLPIAETNDSPPIELTRESVASGRYPLDRYLYIFARQPIDRLVSEYLSLVLSREGQSAIGADGLGYIPLNATEIAEERAKLKKF